MNLIFLVFLNFFHGNPAPAETVNLQIIVTNIHSIKGDMKIGLFNDSKSFLTIGREYKTYSKKVTNDSVIFMINGLSEGDYAISVYHDINSDNKCNLNFFGMPIEPYGFSQNFKPKFSKPKFDECKVNVQKDKSLTIKLIGS